MYSSNRTHRRLLSLAARGPQVSATGADSRLAEGGGPYSTWTGVALAPRACSSSLVGLHSISHSSAIVLCIFQLFIIPHSCCAAADMDVAVWQTDATLVVLVVSMVPRPLKQVVTVSPIVAVAKPS